MEDILRRKQERRSYNLRIWSAGCSTGQEPYTLPWLVADALAYYYLRNPLPFESPLPKPMVPPPWRVEILASDINYSVLRAAQEGSYGRAPDDRGRLWLPLALFRQNGRPLRVKKNVKELVHFDFHNLKTEYFAAAQRHHFLPQRDDVFRRSRAAAVDREVLSLPESSGIPVCRPCGKPAGADGEISDGASQTAARHYQRVEVNV